jgi:hypothetical protein
MPASQPANFNLQEFSDAGLLLFGGRLYTYAYGTTNQKIAYTDPAGTVPHTYTADGAGGQYIALNARGELPAPLYLATGSYDLTLKRGDGSTIWTRKADGVDNTPNSLAAALAAALGSSLVSFIQAGAGAVLRTLQAKIRSMLIDRADFGTQGQFDTAAAAAPTTPTIDANGNYGAKITPFAEPTQLDLKSALLSVAVGPRDALIYRTATSVTISRKFAVMGGFRYRGQYTRGRAPVFPMPASTAADCTGTGLGAETAFRTENWYAAFACANAGDAAAVIKTMPFLRVASVAGSVVSLNKAGEGIHAVAAQTYAWNAVDNLAGTECLVISENGAWSGRVTTITGNGAGYVALADVGALAFGDFLLPAPPSKAHYVYLTSWYMDTAAVRNIYDSGTMTKGKMIYLTTPNIAAGAFAAPGQVMSCAGYISPLATAVIFDSSGSLSTAATGDFAEYFDPDGSNHIVQSGYNTKSLAVTTTYVFDNIQVPFLYYQKFNYYNGGSRPAERVGGQLNITGWIEP